MKYQCLPILLGLACAGQVFGAKVIPNNAAANLVLGQTDFVTSTSVQPSSYSINGSHSVAADPVSGKIFVVDADNNRVLRYPNAASLTNGAGAEAVFGQSRFSTSTGAAGDLGLSAPRGLFFDRMGRLWVADANNNRVLMYEAAQYRASNTNPDRVFGQPDFATTSSGTSATKMSFPHAVFVDSQDTLWVAEFINNRVLRFNSISTKFSGAAADGVLGQTDFSTSTSGSNSSKFSSPTGVAVTAAGTLFVSDNVNHRVMRFDNASTLGNGAGANVVLGQPDFATTTSGITASKIASALGVWITPDDSLWVIDNNNSRVLRFDGASSKSSGAAADGVIGQVDFTSNSAGTTDRKVNLPFAKPFVDASGSLWIPDSENNRVLRFPPDVTKPVLVVTSTVPKTVSKKSLLIKGTASDAYGIAKIQYKVNSGAVKTASGTTSWQFTAALKSGSNTVTINAIDSVGNLSTSKVFKIKRGSSGVAPLLLTLGD